MIIMMIVMIVMIMMFNPGHGDGGFELQNHRLLLLLIDYD